MAGNVNDLAIGHLRIVKAFACSSKGGGDVMRHYSPSFDIENTQIGATADGGALGHGRSAHPPARSGALTLLTDLTSATVPTAARPYSEAEAQAIIVTTKGVSELKQSVGSMW